MKATVRALHSPDVDIDEYQPADPEDVHVLVQVMAGPSDGPGAESFDVLICTPGRITEMARANGPLLGRHMVLVDRFDAVQIRRFLVGVFEAEEAATWPELGERLGRIGKWEFEDYRP